jgi:endonuclease-3
MAKSISKQQEKVATITDLLETNQKVKNWKGKADPLNELILTLLSQSTTDHNRDMAFARLRQAYPTWEEVLAAGREKVAEQIRPAGLANQKSGRMIAILQWIKNQFGQLNLDFLHEWQDDRIIETFTQLKGVGLKTIAVVMMFSLGRDIFPVDTHVHRICKRLELVPEKANPEKTFEVMKPLVPKGKAYSLHMNLLDFGRTICSARSPRCNVCFLGEICQWSGRTDR